MNCGCDIVFACVSNGGEALTGCEKVREESDDSDPSLWWSYAGQKLHAAIVTAPDLQHVEVASLNTFKHDPDAIADEICEMRPRIVGFTAYVWSFFTLLEVAKKVKTRQPDITILFGGPSANPDMFQFSPYTDYIQHIDALCLVEGEAIIRDILRLNPLNKSALSLVPGLAISSGDSFKLTPKQAPLRDLEQYGSVYQLDLATNGVMGYLETFRGCPLSCEFCQWGIAESSTSIFSTEYLVKELRALKKHPAKSVMLLDAAFNLNGKAFKNFVATEREVGLFKEKSLSMELYPTYIRDLHLEFLNEINISDIGVGVQSLNQDTLAGIKRSFDHKRLLNALDALSSQKRVGLEIIYGLPGDNPDSFRRTLDGMLELYAKESYHNLSIRIYRCLVLPGALLKGPPNPNGMDFDPITMEMKSCDGWKAEEITSTMEFLAKECYQMGSNFFIHSINESKDRNEKPGTKSQDSSYEARTRTLDSEIEDEKLTQFFASHRFWRLEDICSTQSGPSKPTTIVMTLGSPEGLVRIVVRTSSDTPAFFEHNDVALSYQSKSNGSAPTQVQLEELQQAGHDITRLVGPLLSSNILN